MFQHLNMTSLLTRHLLSASNCLRERWNVPLPMSPIETRRGGFTVYFVVFWWLLHLQSIK